MLAKIRAIFFYRFLWNNGTILHGKNAKYRHVRTNKPELKSRIINGSETIYRINFAIEYPCPGACSLLAGDAVETIYNIPRCQLPSFTPGKSVIIMKKNIVAQMKSIR